MIIKITPMGAVRQNRSDRWRERPAVLRYRSYKDALRLHWGSQELPERLILVFTLPMPKSWSKKRKTAMLGQPHQQRPDIDNLAKGVMDALASEDSYIYELHATKVWGEEGKIEIWNT